MRRHLKSVPVAVGVAMALLLFSSYSFAAGEKPIKWGFLDCMSGTFGVFGKGNINGTKLAIKEINDAGGVMGRRIEMIVEDTEANTEIAARKARKLILRDKVDVIQGSASTSVTAMIMKVVAQYKTLHLNSEFDAASILPSKSDYSFHFTALCEETERARMIAISKIYKPSEIKRWLVLYPDYSYGRDMRDLYRRELKRWIPDAEIVAEVKQPYPETDYSTHIVKILEANPQVVVSMQWSGDALNFIKQALPLGFFEKIPVFYFNGASVSAVQTLGDKMPVIWGLTEQGNPYLPKLKEFRKKYYDYFEEWPTSENVVTYYDTVYMYKAAVEKAGSTKPEAVAKALVGMEYHGPGGMRKIKSDHTAEVDMVPIVKWAPGDEFDWSMPTEAIEVPFADIKMSGEELIELGCKWCEGKY